MAIKAFRDVTIFLASNNHSCAANSEKQYSTEEKNSLHVSTVWQLPSSWTSSLLWVVSLLNSEASAAVKQPPGDTDSSASLPFPTKMLPIVDVWCQRVQIYKREQKIAYVQ